MRRSQLILLLVLIAIPTAARASELFDKQIPESVARDQRLHELKSARDGLLTEGVPTERVADVECVGGAAGPFQCDGVDLLSFVPIEEFGGVETGEAAGFSGISDIWGWTDGETGDEYVMIGVSNGVDFFRVTDPTEPVHLGKLPNTAAAQLIWHDMKIYDDHAFIVSESNPHGMRVFDLTRLRGVTEPQTWTEDGRYPLAVALHNLAINEDTGFAYLVGGNAGIFVPDMCDSGLHILDISTPAAPAFEACFPDDGYTHDAQCVLYDGPDADHRGKEICVNSNEDHVAIVDVTDKQSIVRLGEVRYEQTGYTHQGWFTEDQRYFLVGDETDELDEGLPTRTLMLDLTDLDAPTLIGEHLAETPAIDHNMYTRDGLVFQSNYAAGLRVLDTARVGEGRLDEVAFFDTYPPDDEAAFNGTWSNYPFFESGTIAVSGIDEGLFLLRLQDGVESSAGGPVAPGPQPSEPPASEPPASDEPSERPTSEPAPSEEPSEGSEPGRVSRAGGDGRVATSIELSEASFDAAGAAILARADDFPDALAAAALAAEVEGPVLLTGSDRLDPAVAAELDRLGVSRVYLAGGAAALSDRVADHVTALGVAPQRLQGADRFGTAAEIAREVVALGGPVDRAVVARADAFADALSAGGLAAAGRAPILLTATDELPATTREALGDVLPSGGAVTLAGGTAAVGAAPEQQLSDDGYDVARVAGADRYGTAALLAREALNAGASVETVVLASGADFPDALAAAPSAHAEGGTLLLVDPADLGGSPATRDLLAERASDVDRVVLAGGESALSTRVADQVETILARAR